VNAPRRSYVTYLESALDGTRLDAGVEQSVHQGRPLWVRYDLGALRAAVPRREVESRPAALWRWRELLPLSFDLSPVTLGEEATPLLRAERLGRELGFGDLWIKDESRLPTGSFKDRGMAAAVNLALRFGRRRFAVPTNGNAGGSLAAYAAAAGAEAWVFLPRDTPPPNIAECLRAGARTFRVDGLIGDCGRLAREAAAVFGCFDLSTLKEPYRLEGKKTMGLELAAQLGWRLPDAIVYPTGGGTGLIGMWKAFLELRELGWLEDEKLPRMIAVQSDGCAPIVQAFERGERFAEPWKDAQSAAAGIRVPSAVGDFMILDAVRQSGGEALAVPDAMIEEWRRLAARLTGLAICPEAGACAGALLELRKRGSLGAGERVVLFNTASGHKYPAELPPGLPLLDPARPLAEQLAGAPERRCE
jgi:threonine synthase